MSFPIVGIGASAGGIPALRGFLNALPAHPNAAFLIVQHTLPDRPNELHSLFRNWTTLPVCEAAAGMRIVRDHIYVGPSGYSVTVEDGVIGTQPHGRRGPRAGTDTIDTLFESLALDAGPRAIAVVLSGTGADGAAGAIRVKQMGGKVFVQDPATALYDGMPAAVIATGVPRHILPVAALPQAIVSCESLRRDSDDSPGEWAAEVAAAVEGLLGLIRTRGGLDLTGYKTTLLLWSVQQRMSARKVRQLRDYEMLLSADPAELQALVARIPIHVTEFFRDAENWEALGEAAIRPLFSQPSLRPIRVWTPACATGEEAYSVAMLMAEQALAMRSSRSVQIFATDVSTEIVARASRGIFKPRAVQALSAERRRQFLYEADHEFRVKRSLRDKMVFVSQDLLVDPPFAGLDLVTCRNLLIYLQPDAARRVLNLLHSSLAMGGHLFLGRAEAMPPTQRGFELVSAAAKIYRKAAPAGAVDASFLQRRARLRGAQSSIDTPLLSRRGGTTGLPVSFSGGPSAAADRPAESAPAEPLPAGSGADAQEAARWTEALRMSREELEASREELQALNEELKVANDELNDANEALKQLNAQLRDKIAALEMQSRVLSSGAVMTLFLDQDLRIRWFTPAVRQLFPLVPADVGRPITDIAQRFDDRNFVGDVHRVMRENEPRETLVRNVDGRWFLRRIGPYVASTDVVAGAAVTFADVTVRRLVEEELQAQNQELARFNRVTVDRELRMIELKKEINELRAQRGEPARYALEFEAHRHERRPE